MSNNDESYEMPTTSKISITSREEAQEYLQQEAWKMLPKAVEKLKDGLIVATKPKDINDIVDSIRSYAQVRKTSDNAQVAAGAALGVALSGQDFAGAFKEMGSIFGVEGELEIAEEKREALPMKEVKEVETMEIMEKVETLDETETIEDIETIPESQGEEDEESEQNPIRF